ncbi:MAG: hypothetical protein UDK34_04490 [Cyanobacteriota bacterium]|nr:hypothetical protein [Cyanobacteriota bacterium]
MDKWDPNWNNSGYASRDNYWAGAKKACDDIGMSLSDTSKLKSLAKKTTAEKEQLCLWQHERQLQVQQLQLGFVCR